METKPMAKIKTGVWENPRKLGSVLIKICWLYGLVITLTGIKVFSIGMKLTGVMMVFMTSPMWLIIYSRNKYNKIQKELEDDKQ